MSFLRSALFSMLLLPLYACGNAGETSCKDLTVAIADALIENCSDFSERDRFALTVAIEIDLSCSNAVGIANEGEFRDTCLPNIQKLTCTNLKDGLLPADCARKIIYAP
jgi:hypothetical protein